MGSLYLCSRSLAASLALLFLILGAGCRFPRHLAPSDLGDPPQNERREQLEREIADLKFVPTVQNGERLLTLIRQPIYGQSIDVITFTSAERCPGPRDTCLKKIRIFQWESNSHKYSLHDSLLSRRLDAIGAFDLSHSGSADILAYTETPIARKRGMQIWGASSANKNLILRLALDTIIPAIQPWKNGAFCLVEYDTSYAKLLVGRAIRVPKRCYVRSGELYAEAPADREWALIAQRVRDSIAQELSLRKEELTNTNTFGGAEHLLVSAAIGLALIDTDWTHAQTQLRNLLSQYSNKLSSASYNTLLKLSLTSRSVCFIRQSQHESAPILELCGDLDDALAIGDTSHAKILADRLNSDLKNPARLDAVGVDIYSHHVLLTTAEAILNHALQSAPASPVIMRDLAFLLRFEHRDPEARALLQRSLQFDSTSTDALRARTELSQ